MKRFFVTVIVTAALLLSSCSPANADMAASTIKQYIRTECRLIEIDEKNNEHTYTFRDENGITFSFISRKTGSSGLFTQTSEYCDYAYRYIDAHKDDISALLLASPLTCSYEASASQLVNVAVTSKSDIEEAADLCMKIFSTVGEIPIEQSSEIFEIPCICIKIYDHSSLDLPFPCADDTPHTESELYTSINTAYVNAVRDSGQAGDLTGSDLDAVKADKLCIEFDGADTDGYYFTLDDETDCYEIDLYDLIPSKENGADGYSFGELCDKLGISHEETATGMVWSVGNSTFFSKYSPKHSKLNVYKDNAPVCSLTVYYEQDESYLCVATPAEMALMLNCTYQTDNIHGRIKFTTAK